MNNLQKLQQQRAHYMDSAINAHGDTEAFERWSRACAATDKKIAQIHAALGTTPPSATEDGR